MAAGALSSGIGLSFFANQVVDDGGAIDIVTDQWGAKMEAHPKLVSDLS